MFIAHLSQCSRCLPIVARLVRIWSGCCNQAISRFCPRNREVPRSMSEMAILRQLRTGSLVHCAMVGDWIGDEVTLRFLAFGSLHLRLVPVFLVVDLSLVFYKFNELGFALARV